MQILVIEDDERIVNFVRRGLENEGHSVEWALTQSEAYEALVLRDHAFDVIIIDWHLGLEDGMEICREFRRRNIEIPVLMVSAKGEQQEVEKRSLRAGANAYLAKPFAFSTLVAVLEKLTFSNPSPV